MVSFIFWLWIKRITFNFYDNNLTGWVTLMLGEVGSCMSTSQLLKFSTVVKKWMSKRSPFALQPLLRGPWARHLATNCYCEPAQWPQGRKTNRGTAVFFAGEPLLDGLLLQINPPLNIFTWNIKAAYFSWGACFHQRAVSFLYRDTFNNRHDGNTGLFGSQPRQMDYNTRLGQPHGLQVHTGQTSEYDIHAHTHATQTTGGWTVIPMSLPRSVTCWDREKNPFFSFTSLYTLRSVFSSLRGFIIYHLFLKRSPQNAPLTWRCKEWSMPLVLWGSREGWSPSRLTLGERGGGTPTTSRQRIAGLTRWKKEPFTLAQTGNLESPINIGRMSLDCGREPERPRCPKCVLYNYNMKNTSTIPNVFFRRALERLANPLVWLWGR